MYSTCTSHSYVGAYVGARLQNCWLVIREDLKCQLIWTDISSVHKEGFSERKLLTTSDCWVWVDKAVADIRLPMTL